MAGIGIEKLAPNGVQETLSTAKKQDGTVQNAAKPTKDNEKLTGTLDGLAASNSALIKKAPPEIQDISLTDGEKEKVYFYYKDNAGKVQKKAFLLDKDNSNVIPMQGHQSGLGAVSIASDDYPVQEAWYNGLAYYLRDLQYNKGKFSDEAKIELEEQGIKEEEMMTKIEDNLKKQREFVSNLKPSSDDCILYRYMNLDSEMLADTPIQWQVCSFNEKLSNLKTGEKTILDWAPIHTTGDSGFISEMSEIIPIIKHDIFRIKTPKGSKLVSGKPVEDGITEVIFPSKSEFKFLGKNSYDGINIWDFEYIPPEE